MKTTDGGAAFPIVHPNPRTGDSYVLAYGMSLRDYFAAKAMEGLLVSIQFDDRIEYGPAPQVLAAKAYVLADAMLKARSVESRDLPASVSTRPPTESDGR